MKRIFWFVALLLAACCLLSLVLGEYRMTLPAVLAALFDHQPSHTDRFILLSVRLPRILVGLMTGFAFGVSGSMLQSLLRNPLADPGILGFNDGAGLFVTLFLVYLPQAAPWLITPVAFLGAAASILLLLTLTARLSFQPLSVLLNGIGLSFCFYAVTKIVKTVGDWQRVQGAIDWLQGNLTGVTWPQFFLVLPWFLFGVSAALATAKLLEVHELGADVAIGLGSRLRRERLLLLAVVAILSGSAISVTGPVYFVGFLAGNLAQTLLAASKRAVLVLSGIIGAAIVVVADLLARIIVAPREIRLFFLVNIVGAPLLVWLLIARTRAVPIK